MSDSSASPSPFYFAGAPHLQEQISASPVRIIENTEHRTVSSSPLAQKLSSGAAMMSFVIPLYNEMESLPELHRRIKAAAADFAPNHEIIFVDDGSHDRSYETLRALWESDTSVSVIRFRRNSGKAAGLSAGFKRVRGDIVVMMDADLQDQPEEIPNLIAKMDEGYDLVTGWKQRRHDPLNKTLPSKLFNGTVSRYYKLDIHDFNCGLKIMRACVAKEVRLYGDFHRFIPVLAASNGYRVTECVVEHAPRVHGVSKYGAKRLITGMLDFSTSILITKFYHKPLQMFGPIGLATSLAGLGVGLYLLAETLLGQSAHIRPLWMVMVLLLLGGAQIFFTGMLAELIVNTTQRNTGSYDVAHLLEARAEASDEKIMPEVREDASFQSA